MLWSRISYTFTLVTTSSKGPQRWIEARIICQLPIPKRTTRRRTSTSRDIRVSNFGNRTITVYDRQGTSRNVKGRAKLAGHIEGYQDSIEAYNKKGEPITILPGKVVSLKKAFGEEILGKTSHIQINNQLIPIVRVENRVEITKLKGTIPGQETPLTLYHVEETEEDDFSIVEDMKGRLPDITEESIKNINQEYHSFLYETDNTASPVEGYTDDEVKKPKPFKINFRVYDHDYNSVKMSSSIAVSNTWFLSDNEDIVSAIVQFSKSNIKQRGRQTRLK